MFLVESEQGLLVPYETANTASKRLRLVLIIKFN